MSGMPRSAKERRRALVRAEPNAQEFLESIEENEQSEVDNIENVVTNPDVQSAEIDADKTVTAAEEQVKESTGVMLPLGPPMLGLTTAQMKELSKMYAKLIVVVPKTIPKTAMQTAMETLDELVDHETYELKALSEQHRLLKLAKSRRDKSLYNWRKTLDKEDIPTKKDPTKTYKKIVYERGEDDKIIYPESAVGFDGSMCNPADDIAMAKKFKHQLTHIGMFIGVLTVMLEGDVSSVIQDPDNATDKSPWMTRTAKLHKSAKALRMQVLKAEPLHNIGQANKREVKVKDMAYGKHFLPVVAMQMARKNLVGGQVSASASQPRSRSVGRPRQTRTDAKPGWMNNLGM